MQFAVASLGMDSIIDPCHLAEGHWEEESERERERERETERARTKRGVKKSGGASHPCA